jgi:hypothetical protein
VLANRAIQSSRLNYSVTSMITYVVLTTVLVMSVAGGSLAFCESHPWRRNMSLAAAVASTASVGSFARLLSVYNSRPLGLITATHNPLTGLAPWDLLVLVFGSAAIFAGMFGAHRPRILLILSGVLMCGFVFLVLTVSD